jgi:hypothetical protein
MLFQVWKNFLIARSFLCFSDVAWSSFVAVLTHKVAKTGGEVVQVASNNTSQLCSACGAKVPKTLGVRVHLALLRASMVILRCPLLTGVTPIVWIVLIWCRPWAMEKPGQAAWAGAIL